MATTLNQLRQLCTKWERYDTTNLRDWDVFNVPENPPGSMLADFLTVGIEKIHGTDYFADDAAAYDWVKSQAQPDTLYETALRIHDLADQLRLAAWGDKDRRTPPQPGEVRPDVVSTATTQVFVETPKGMWIPFPEAAEIDFEIEAEALAQYVKDITGLSRVTVERTTKVTV